ncbi:MAG TPA: ABC transporter ATP-binding protein [Chloroflexi bacterium]|nr:ABC transporter ATP-binding protein [Chloroflexota bacterium]
MEPILQVKDLKKYFRLKGGWFGRPVFAKAVDAVSFTLYEGETLGLVGESGSGKSTTGRAILRLIEPTAGSIMYRGTDIMTLRGEKLRSLRKHLQMMFQDPYAALNPRMTVGEAITEPMLAHGMYSPADAADRACELLEAVGLDPSYYYRYPHEFSGGQKQRISMARSLAVSPDLLVADEPVSALDVSIQAQIINLFKDLQDEFGITYLFIAHDLSVVKYLSDRIAVMYLGEIIELAEKHELFDHPLHPYTRALISAIPIPDPTVRKKRIILEGDIPSPTAVPQGCRFSTRCPMCRPLCYETHPEIRDVGAGHWVRCHLVGQG